METQDTQLESLLRRYKPVAPDAAMRNRVLTAARAAEPVSLHMKLWWGSIAAMFLLSGILFFSAIQAQQQTTAMLLDPPKPLPPEAETAIALLGGDEAARQYVTLAYSIEPKPQYTSITSAF